MCGFVAAIAAPWRDAVPAALEALESRGPDARTLMRQDDAVFGHARLAVLDLVGGGQPMSTDDGRWTIVYNGEIYNCDALRRELVAAGRTFRTRSDTEVILRGVEAEGAAFVRRLDGMFAFVVWDRVRRTAVCARDRFGVKPLFYSTRGGLTAASTLAAFHALPGFPLKLEMHALRDYLACQAPLAPQSFLEDVLQLPPASILVWSADQGRAEVERYWEIPAPPSGPPAATRDELGARADGLLREAVRAQLMSDVPVGAFLSGGVDSSLLVAYMADAGVSPLRTFSMRFDDPRFDESAAARDVAARFGTQHHVVEPPKNDSTALLDTIDAMDQPLADPALVTTRVLAREARKHVAVVLSGDGADELFGGYARFRDGEAATPDGPARRLLRALVVRRCAPGFLLRRSLAGRDRLLHRRVELGPWPVGRKSLATYLVPEALAACASDDVLGLWRRLCASFGPRVDSAALMRADLWTYLSENCLVKSDRASMAFGLEIRVPFLANDVADFALSLPAEAHLEPRLKAILRSLAEARLPASVWNRPKHGFSVPLGALFDGPWRDVCEATLQNGPRHAPFLRHDKVAELWRDRRKSKRSLRLLYTFIVLLRWLERRRLSY